MKKNKLILAVATVLTLASLAACGSAKKGEISESASVDTATASELSAEDKAIAELENTVVPEMPKGKDMGYIKMVDLSTITVETTPKVIVDDDMIDNQIKSLMSIYKDEVDGPAELGDTVNIDYVGKIDGVAFDGGTGSKYDLTLGSGQFIDGFEDQLVGAKAGDKVTVNVTFPENYGKEELNGKPAVFEVTVNKVSRTAELTDEWLKKHGEEAETEAKTVDEFREEQRKLLQTQADYSYDNNIQQQALQQIVDNSEIGLTTEMKDYAEAYVIRSEIDNVKQYGYGLSDMLKMYGMTVDDFKDEIRDFASDYAGQRIVINYIADEQGISATDEVVDALVEKLSTVSGRELNKVQLIEQFGGDMVKEEAVNDAVLRYIQSQIKIVEKDASEIAEESAVAAESESTEEKVEETKATNDLEGEGGFKTKKVTDVYSTEAGDESEAESESNAK